MSATKLARSANYDELVSATKKSPRFDKFRARRESIQASQNSDFTFNDGTAKNGKSDGENSHVSKDLSNNFQDLEKEDSIVQLREEPSSTTYNFNNYYFSQQPTIPQGSLSLKAILKDQQRRQSNFYRSNLRSSGRVYLSSQTNSQTTSLAGSRQSSRPASRTATPTPFS